MTKNTYSAHGLCSAHGLHDEAILTLTTLAQYVKDHPDGPVIAVDYDIEAAIIMQFMVLHLPSEVYKRVFKAEVLLQELHDAVKGYRGDRMPLRDAHLNEVFAKVRQHLNNEEG